MQNRFSLLLLIAACLSSAPMGIIQDNNTTEQKAISQLSLTTEHLKNEIADIKVSGVKNYEDYVPIGISGLGCRTNYHRTGRWHHLGSKKRYWRHGLFSDVKITADKIIIIKIYLSIQLTQRPRITDIVIHGVKRVNVKICRLNWVWQKVHRLHRTWLTVPRFLIKKHFDEKGFKNAEVNIIEREDPENKEQVYVDVNIDKKAKVKVHQITIDGNEGTDRQEVEACHEEDQRKR